MIGIYLHVPFCTVRCSYCDFYLLPTGGRPPGERPFVDALRAEIAAAGARHAGLVADTVHFGGGTPSLLDPAAIRAIVETIARDFRLTGGAEIGLEANPEDLTPERLAALRAAGITRLTVGVQAFEDRLLALLRRPHDAARATTALAAARATGFASLGADLILGLPSQTATQALDGVRRAVDLGVDHLSLYLLEIHDRTRLGRALALGRLSAPPADDSAALYEAAADALQASGFEHYEISNFARPGHRSRHNLKYWTDLDYLGFGPSAHSYLAGERWANPADLAGYLAAGGAAPRVEDRQPAAVRGREALYAGLRLLEGVDLAALERRHGGGVPRPADPILDDLAGAGLVVLQAGRLRLTRRGRLLSNEVFERLS